ncbi:NTF2 fold immunity protein [Cloacibacterium sp.]|uniref:NTF2 fold immunity protein n=1 Tax=Cloacibacterium sp. TaxID=1913682 RepID=UPI0035AFC9EB
MKKILQILLILVFSSSFSQSKNPDLERARKFVEESLNDKTAHNVIVKKTSQHLLEKQTIIKIAEAALFQIYGKENILKQRPYKTYRINNFWLIEGTLKSYFGGVFQIIIDDRTGEIKRITHGK